MWDTVEVYWQSALCWCAYLGNLVPVTLSLYTCPKKNQIVCWNCLGRGGGVGRVVRGGSVKPVLSRLEWPDWCAGGQVKWSLLATCRGGIKTLWLTLSFLCPLDPAFCILKILCAILLKVCWCIGILLAEQTAFRKHHKKLFFFIRDHLSSFSY
jgi:hypothetical protein